MACRNCRPKMYPDGRKLGHHHIACRFMECGRDYKFVIKLNGEDVTADTTEAIAGPEGLVCLFVAEDMVDPAGNVIGRRNIQCNDCHRGAAEQVFRGHVMIDFILYPERNCHCINCGSPAYLPQNLINRTVIPFCSYKCKHQWEREKKLVTLGAH